MQKKGTKHFFYRNYIYWKHNQYKYEICVLNLNIKTKLNIKNKNVYLTSLDVCDDWCLDLTIYKTEWNDSHKYVVSHIETYGSF